MNNKVVLQIILMSAFIIATACSKHDVIVENPPMTRNVFLEQGKHWIYEYRPYGGQQKYNYSYFIQGDTIVAGKCCYKLYAENEWGKNTIEYKCAIYEEDGKVRYFPYNQETSVALYDFGASVGDTILCQSKATGIPTEAFFLYVDHIDTVSIPGMELRRFHLYYLRNGKPLERNPEIWVEGIGGRHDLFSSGSTRGNLFHFSSCTIHGLRIEDENVFK